MRDQFISDDALLAFAMWCRWNGHEFVRDPVLLRRIFNAYASLGRMDEPPGLSEGTGGLTDRVAVQDTTTVSVLTADVDSDTV